MDKLQKVRAYIERLIGDYNIKTEKYRCMNEQAHQYYGGKRDALSEILKSIDSSQEEHKKCMYYKDDYTNEDRKVLCNGCEEECKYSKSDDFTKALAECINQAQCNVVDPLVLAETWKDELIKLAKSEEPVSEDLDDAANKYIKWNYSPWLYKAMFDCFKAGAKWQKAKDESTTEDLGEYINELSKQFPEVSFAKLSRIAVRVAKWQKEQIKRAMDLGEPPYLISVEQAYYRTLKLLE